MINCTLINNETGEVLNEAYKITELEDQMRYNKFAEKKKLDAEFRTLQQEYLGYFVFFIFENIDKLTEILSDADLMRFLYLGTYTKRDGHLKFENGNIITKKHVKGILKSSDTVFKVFWRNVIDNKLIIIEDDSSLLINLDYFYRGSQKEYYKLTDEKMGNTFTRLYIETTRSLYENSVQRALKKLSIIYKILPYISWQYNVVCTNPKETCKSKIEALTIQDISNILRYDKTNISKFKQELHDLKYEGNSIFIRIGKTKDVNQDFVIVNPQFYYRGNLAAELDYLLLLFGLRKGSLVTR